MIMSRIGFKSSNIFLISYFGKCPNRRIHFNFKTTNLAKSSAYSLVNPSSFTGWLAGDHEEAA
jgi:hypothetical protein